MPTTRALCPSLRPNRNSLIRLIRRFPFFMTKHSKALLTVLVFFLLAALPAFAQDPGSNLGTALQTMFSGPLIIGLSTVGIVIGGCLVIFGGGMAIRALGSVLLGAILILDAAKLVSYIQTVI